MKKFISLILIITTFSVLSACGGAADTLNPNVSASAQPSETALLGSWCVSSLLAPDGTPATAEEMQQLGAGFTIELLQGGVYFIYDANGKVLGQGQYTIDSGKLTCTVGETTVVYTIEDSGMLRCRAQDGSVTLLARSPVQFTPGGNTGDDSDVVDEGSPDDADAPDDADTIVSDSPDTEPETDADAPDDGGVVEDDQDSPDTETNAG